jgi:transglutaminase-like putative cysteine protease
MHRRDFLRYAGATSAALAMPGLPRTAHAADEPAWRTFEVTTTIEVLKPSAETRVWVPTPLTVDTPYQTTIGSRFDAPGGTTTFFEDPRFGVGMVRAEWPAGAKPVLTLASRARTRDYTVDLSRTAHAAIVPPDADALRRFLEPTRLIPTDGIVKERALEITRSARSDVERARAIYEWIVENTFRDPKTRGCGIGDIRFMLESGSLGGKCADLNALFVGLARAVGIPARDAYGLRVAKSRLGYTSLGAASDIVTRAQHCRAEAYLVGYGWVPVDPADVRKMVLEEPPGNLPVSAEVVERARNRLFGSWEMNWIAYNFANDVALPGSALSRLGFLMYPQAETGEGRLDSLDPDAFRYEIVAREIGAPA